MDKKTLLRTLRGQKLSPPPLWFMRQAGRTLPEYRALRGTVDSFLSLCFTPDLATTVTLQPVQRFDLDAAILFSDILIVPYGLGCPVTFQEGQGPRVDNVFLESLPTFNNADFFEKTKPIYETVAAVQAKLSLDKTLIGFAGGPWTVASYLFPQVTSGGRKDRFAPLLAHLIPQKQAFEKLLSLLTRATIFYLDQQVQAGADVLQIFESWAGVLPPSLFEAWVLGPVKEIVVTLKKKYPRLPIIVFLKESSGYLPWIVEVLGPWIAGINLDHHVDPMWVKEVVPTHIALQGGLDPRVVLAGGAVLETEVNRLLTAFQERPYIFNLSHGFLPETPLSHIEQVVQQVKSFKGAL